MLLVFPPYATPASPPYALAYLHAFLARNGVKTQMLDLNLVYHTMQFPASAKFFSKPFDLQSYALHSSLFKQISFAHYSENNKRVIAGKMPDHMQAMVDAIVQTGHKTVAMSIVYSSQSFYASALVDALAKLNISCIVGGPAVHEALKEKALYLPHEVALLEHMKMKFTAHKDLVVAHDVDYSSLSGYFSPAMVYPLRLSSACYYKQCTFCTHHNNKHYVEYDLKALENTILLNNAQFIFITDDMVPKMRLLRIAKIMKKHNVQWMCQLRPTKEYDASTLQVLYNSGLRIVLWGVESFSQRILDLMKKGTHVADVQRVLAASHTVGIKNVAYMLFGFPTETREEMENTIALLQEQPLDLISTAIFGLQKGSPVYMHPQDYGLTITEIKRFLNPKLTYTVSKGMQRDEAKLLRKRRMRVIDSVNKYPRMMNYFREHMLVHIAQENYDNKPTSLNLS